MQRRRLPHFYPEGQPLFLTFALQGALPPNQYPPPDAPNAGAAFVWMDRYLDSTRKGPLYLRRPELAQVVVDAILFCQESLSLFEVDAFVVMPNHVHLLADPKSSPTRFLRTLKSFTARECNKRLGRAGAFWQSETYDRAVRNEDQRRRIRQYVHQNPVRAGLAAQAADYPASSAYLVAHGSAVQSGLRPDQ